MTVTVSMIRSGGTAGGRAGRYVGRADEPIDEQARAEILRRVQDKLYRPAQLVFASPLLRSRETAQLIHRSPAILMRELSAFDYGEFEGRTYAEIVSDERFRAWAESEQLLACPGGEGPHEFNSRCIAGFRRIVEEMTGKGLSHAAVVTHQAVIRTILQRYCVPRAFYHPWRVAWGQEIAVEFDLEHLALRVIQKN